jgi:prepilin-type N-terminal cleavage/methylation domain-containing protein
VIVRRRRGATGPVRRGVSLIEVLLATAIFLIAIAGISVLTRVASDNAAEAARTNQCSRLARSKMAELEAGVGDAPLSGGASGTFAEYPTYQWQVDSVPVGASGYTYDVTVRVWIETGTMRPTEVSLSQIILDPAAMNNAAPISPPAPPTTTEPPP